MSTLLLIFGAAILALVILDHIPGIRHLISPVMSAFSTGTGLVLGSLAGWVAWSIKTFFRDHAVFLRHLVSRRRDIDPSDPYR